jgi:type I restriction enzyme R subunit
MPEPEALARIAIDRQLDAAGWVVQDRDQLNLFAGPGIAIREVSIPGAGEGRASTFNPDSRRYA